MAALIIVLLCLFLNALLSCAEMAFVTVDKKKLRGLALAGDRRAKAIQHLQEIPERLLSAIQIGITLVGAVSAAVSGAGAEETLTPILMGQLGVAEATAETISILIVVVPLTGLSVVIGELVPKSIALRYSMPVVLNLAHGLSLAEKILGPLIGPMEAATKFFLRVLFPKNLEDEVVQAADEVSLAGLKKEHKQYIFNLIDLDAKLVAHRMVPWDKVDVVSFSAEPAEVLEKIVEVGRTRFPVMADNDVCGFLHAKEFLNLFRVGAADTWVNFMRPPRFISPSMKLLDVLKLMQREKIHLVIVGDQENPQGILTLEDVIEEVIGDIIDEDEDGRFELALERLPRRIKLKSK
jgi:putative hemolysin